VHGSIAADDSGARALALAAALVCAGATSAWAGSGDAGTSPSASFALTHVTVVDPVAGAQPERTVLVAEGRIVAVGPAAEVAVPLGAAVHDGTGRFVIPGLWDMHVHLSQVGAMAFPVLLSSGVTSVRDMGSDLAEIRRWQAARAEGQPIPRIVTPGPKLDEGNLLERLLSSAELRVVTSPADARRAVDGLKAKGVDFIKVHNVRTAPVYEAIADEARRQGLAIAGHIPSEPGPLGAAGAGQRTIEHGRGMLPCSPEIRARIRAAPERARLERYCAPEATQDQVLPALRRSGTWLTPTLVSWRGNGMVGDPALASWLERLPGIEVATPALRRHWQAMAGPTPGALERELVRGFGPLALAAHRAGVPLLAGTDLGDPYVIPGHALHDELQLLVEAGLSPLDALRSATLEPARAVGLAADLGSIRAGAIADLVVLDADPLSDIRNTRRIRAVVAGGRWLDAR